MSVSQTDRERYHVRWFGLAANAVEAAAEPMRAVPWLSKLALGASQWVGPTAEPNDTRTCGALAAIVLDYAKCSTIAERRVRAEAMAAYGRLVCGLLITVAPAASEQPLPSSPPRRRLDLDGPADE